MINDDHEFEFECDDHKNSSEDDLTDDEFECEPNVPQLPPTLPASPTAETERRYPERQRANPRYYVEH